MVGISRTQRKLGVALFVIVLLAVLGGIISILPGASNQGYAPEQPIPFSHKLHAGTHKMECLYCHSSAEKSRHATVPPPSVCMNCHNVVKTNSPYIQQIRKAYTEGKPIEWIRIHEVPDFVYFSHKRHVLKGVSCETCHGNVKEMERVYQASSLTMGWCMECHRGQTTPRQIVRETYPHMKNPQGPVAPVSCDTCHR